MSYQQFSPHIKLSPYIDAYWRSTHFEKSAVTNRILPDGCIDIIVNLGTDYSTEGGEMIMKNEHTYLVGTMTRFKQITDREDTVLIGIRFKPAAFPYFYSFSSLHEVANTTIEFEEDLVPVIVRPGNLVQNLDYFFLNRFRYPKKSVLSIVDDIHRYKGQLTVEGLAEIECTTSRQLERSFREFIGVSPKEFIRFVRYQFALQNIHQHYPGQSLLTIAFDSGYYDHSHLLKDVKEFSGQTPALLV
jgi:AraC-like DNA-binding protein